MQATLTLLERGHKVVLFEKEATVGGNLIAAASMELKADMEDYLDYITQQVMMSGADIRLNTAATADIIRELAPDALVIAAGAVPFMPDVPGIELPHVHWAADADMGKCAVGGKIVLIGGGALGIESAVTQSARGKQVTVLELLPQLGAGADTTVLLPMLEEKGAAILTGRKLTAIYPDAVECLVLATGETERHACDTVLVSAVLSAQGYRRGAAAICCRRRRSLSSATQRRRARSATPSVKGLTPRQHLAVEN
jgi:pyruvate/2-oxoglutarate dehydrogenase complex dihydrolipoamide dehydrogenase (E3) component